MMHSQSNYSRQTHKFIPADPEPLYRENMKDPEKAEYLQSTGLSSVTYTFNSDGFRTRELEEGTKNFVALGCSFTMGAGVHSYQSWPELVSLRTGVSVYNLGVFAAAPDTLYRIAKKYLEYLKPQFVMLLIPPKGRYEYFNGERFKVITTASNDYGELHTYNSIYDEVLDLNYEKNIMCIQHICDSMSVPLVVMDSSEFKSYDAGRDFNHQGPKSHAILAKQFYQALGPI